MYCQEFVVFNPPGHQIIVGLTVSEMSLTSQEMTCILEDKGVKPQQNFDSFS